MSLPRQQPPLRIRRKVAPLCKSFLSRPTFYHLDILSLSYAFELWLTLLISMNRHPICITTRNQSVFHWTSASASATFCWLMTRVCGEVIKANYPIEWFDFLVSLNVVTVIPSLHLFFLSKIYTVNIFHVNELYVISGRICCFFSPHDLTSEAECCFVATGFTSQFRM